MPPVIEHTHLLLHHFSQAQKQAPFKTSGLTIDLIEHYGPNGHETMNG